MIILDTHIWVWWVDDNERLTEKYRQWIKKYQSSGLGVSVISVWEVAKLVEKKRLVLTCTIEEWLEAACAYSEVQILNLTVPIIVRSTQLEGFHADPADQLIVATAQVYDCFLLTVDQKILNYSEVKTFKP